MCAGLTLFTSSACSREANTPGGHIREVVSLADSDLEARVGVDRPGERLATFHHVLDAVLLDTRIVVLDASPPFVRLFDRNGKFLGSAVPAGDGPAEARRPLSIARAGPDRVVVVQTDKLILLDSSGRHLRTYTDYGRQLAGAFEGCGGMFKFVTDHNEFEAPGTITFSRSLTLHEDTAARLGHIRSNSRRVHPFFEVTTEDRAVFYTEEAGMDRLMVVPCANRKPYGVHIDSLGPQEHFQPTGPGTFALHGAQPPRPAGLGVVNDHILWAVQVRRDSGAGSDSLTLITTIHDESRCRMYLSGWFQILDSNGGDVLLGAEDPTPLVLKMSASTLTNMMLRHGVGDSAHPKACSQP